MLSLDAYAGMGMSPAELAARYRLHATDCLNIAQTVLDEACKLSLLDMARAWNTLAEQAEKNSGAFLFYERPTVPPEPKKF